MNFRTNWKIVRDSLLGNWSARWIPVNCRPLTVDEKKVFINAKVVTGQYGLSLEVHLKNGETSYIPMCNTMLKPGNTLKADDIRIVTLFMKPDYICRAIEKWNAPRCKSRRLCAFKQALWYKVLKPIRDLQWKIQGKKASIFEDLTLY